MSRRRQADAPLYRPTIPNWRMMCTAPLGDRAPSSLAASPCICRRIFLPLRVSSAARQVAWDIHNFQRIGKNLNYRVRISVCCSCLPTYHLASTSRPTSCHLPAQLDPSRLRIRGLRADKIIHRQLDGFFGGHPLWNQFEKSRNIKISRPTIN